MMVPFATDGSKNLFATVRVASAVTADAVSSAVDDAEPKNAPPAAAPVALTSEYVPPLSASATPLRPLADVTACAFRADADAAIETTPAPVAMKIVPAGVPESAAAAYHGVELARADVNDV